MLLVRAALLRRGVLATGPGALAHRSIGILIPDISWCSYGLPQWRNLALLWLICQVKVSNVGTNELSGSLPGDDKVFFFWLGAAWVKSRAERPSVSGVNRQLHVQIGCKLGIRNREDELTKQAKRNELQINPKVIKGVNACRKRTRSS